MIDPGLAGRVALVTGGNHGIGAAIARALAAQGVAVLVSYLRLDDGDSQPAAYAAGRASSADGVLAAIRSAGGTAVAVEADLADASTPEALLHAAEEALGPVEILVNNASGWVQDTFLAATADRFGRPLRPVDAASHDRQFAVDARAAALLVAGYARRHLDRGASWGRIVGITSAGTEGLPDEVSYGAAKAALESYTKSAALELGPYGITANLVHPPATDTGWVTDEVRAAVTASSPLRHVATPDEVAEVVTYLASEQARYLTAQVLRMS